jgi:hypothetical protein
MSFQAIERDRPNQCITSGEQILSALEITSYSVRSAKSLEALYQASEPLRKLFPELEHYAGDPSKGEADRFASDVCNREFPRMIGSLVNLGIMLRACKALDLCDLARKGNQLLASHGQHNLSREYFAFTRQLSPENQPDIDQHFSRLVRLFQPLVDDPKEIETVIVALVVSDMAKMPHIKEYLTRADNTADVSDHEVALGQLFKEIDLNIEHDLPKHSEVVVNLFPSFARLDRDQQKLICGEVLLGANIGQLLQMEVGSADLSGVCKLVRRGPQAVRHWLLPAILDISSARAQSDKPETWSGSSLINRPLAADLALFSELIENLDKQTEEQFLNDFSNSVAKRHFYRSIFNDQELLATDKQQQVFRLARYLSLETDHAHSHEDAARELCNAWNKLSNQQREIIGGYLMRSGANPDEPRPVATYMVYMFSQLYARHFELPQALDRCLPSLSNMLEVVLEGAKKSKTTDCKTGMPVFSGEALWRTLRLFEKSKLEAGPLRFRIRETVGGTPELVLDDN